MIESLAVQRLRTLQQKKESLAKASRRDIATLIERGKLETARIKAENLINEDIHVELLELLEMYCELLLARFGLLEMSTREPEPGVSEGVCSIIHAAPRTELKELHVLREMLMHKYGREFSISVMENRNNCVSERVMKKLIMATPSPKLVDAYLSEIAKGYAVEWSVPITEGNGGDTEEPVPQEMKAPLELSDTTSLSKIAQDNPKLPDLPPTEETATSEKSAATEPRPPPLEDDFTALTRRFAALKKR